MRKRDVFGLLGGAAAAALTWKPWNGKPEFGGWKGALTLADLPPGGDPFPIHLKSGDIVYCGFADPARCGRYTVTWWPGGYILRPLAEGSA